MEKNKTFNGTIIDINDDGDGILKVDSEVIFVPDTIPNEEVTGVIIDSRSKFSIGKVTNILSKSESRVTPPCEYSTSCGGCTLQHINYSDQLLFKQNKVKRAFKKIAKIDITPHETISANPFRYRNKIAMPIDPKTKSVGLFRTNSHKIVPVSDCLITKEWIKPLINIVNEFIKQYDISIYNDETKSGLLKHIVAREVDNNLLITLVINGDKLNHLDALTTKLNSVFSNNYGLNLNINKLCNNCILTENFVHEYGLKSLQKTEFGITHPITNASFMQINDEICEKIYESVLENIDSNEIVINAYSGAGLLTALISTKAKYVYGIEIVKDATISANELKLQNHITNITNICGDCTKELPNLIRSKKIDDFTLVIDPPRKGITKEVVDSIISSKPNKIIYVSCNPQTLARDISLIMNSNNYNISSVTPFDMFPQTAHVETLCILTK